MANQYKNKIVYNGTILLDLSGDTVTLPEHIMAGFVGHLSDGRQVTGTGTGSGSGSGCTRTVIANQQTITPVYRSSENISGYMFDISITEGLEEWGEYIVTFNGTEYYSTAILRWGTNILIGEESYFWDGKSYPYPFGILYESGNICTIAVGSGDSISIKIEKIELTGAGGGTAAISVVDTEDSHGGIIRTVTALDISDTTAIASDVAQGKYFYTADGTKTLGTSSGGGSSSGQTVTGTVTGSGTTVLQIPCSFEPDLIHLYADLTGDASLRGITTLTIIKDVVLYQVQDGSSGGTNESTWYLRNITGYNESDTVNTHASYSNGTLTIDTVSNTAAYRFTEGITYTYKLSTIGTRG